VNEEEQCYNFIMRITSIILRFVVLGLLGTLAGCDWSDDPDHAPPAGYGALFIDNNTPHELRVYVDGAEKGRVRAYGDRPFDLRPGLYRVILDQRGTSRNWRDSVDVIEGRLTVLDVAHGLGNELDVVVFFD
jgi:hypothetical protein